MRRWTLHTGDCLAILRTLPDASCDGLLSDPPSGIGFMGAEWDKDKGGRDEWIAWLEEIMREALRVLKPGAHGLVWALPRTSHWTGMALEKAGFVVRDRVSHIFATGFPKSLAIDKAIDARNGDERPVVGQRDTLVGNGGTGSSFLTANSRQRLIDVTSAASAASAAWSGYGTALKPAGEDWWLVMKPLEGTFAENALAHGVGGINIDASRIGYVSEDDKAAAAAAAAAQRSVQQNHGVGVGNYGLHGEAAASSLDGFLAKQDLGRWPSHIVLSHSPGCRVVGTRAAKRGIMGNDPTRPVKSVGFTRGSVGQTIRTEVTEVTECEQGCPVKLLDEQSGDRPGMSGGGSHREDYAGGMFGAIDAPHLARNDSGGASRFFFCAKPSTSEREFGCDDLPVRSAGECTQRGEVAESEEDRRRAGLNSPRAGANRNTGARNHHPTIKSVRLAQYLATLIAPPVRADGDRCLLVPFAGSGTEMVGAIRAGWDHVIGIERDTDYVAIAEARLARWAEVPEGMDPADVKPLKTDARQVDLFASLATAKGK